MILEKVALSRVLITVTAVVVVLGLVGNIAPGIAAKAAGYALFCLVVTSPGLLFLAVRQATKRQTREPIRPGPVRRIAGIFAFAVIAVIGAIAAVFLVVLIGLLVGAPGSDRYPDTTTRVLIISLVGLPFLAGGALVVWTLLGPRRRYFSGLRRMAAGKVTEALEVFESAKQHRPLDPGPWEGAAMSLLALGRSEEAFINANRAVEIERRWQSLHMRGLTLAWAGATEEALADLEEAASLTRNPFVLASLGSALVGSRQLDLAIARLTESRRRFPWMGTSLTLGEAYRLRGMPEEAKAAYEYALANRMPHPAAKSIAAYALAQLGRVEEAREAATSAIAQEIGRPVALLAQAYAGICVDDLDTTERALREIMEHSAQLAVEAITDPQFTPLLTEGRFKSLLAEALLARSRLLEAILPRLI
jgi:tetratricopeptide (TPR) repeat protein